jgi:putative tryptophan/tyrosine transport system substrate-binding protein
VIACGRRGRSHRHRPQSSSASRVTALFDRLQIPDCVLIEQRYAAGAYERLSGLATELISSNVDVIVVDGTAAAKACKDATTTVPIVFTLSVDPVADGLATSFAHPGGNLTGLTMAAGYGLAGKRLELLKDMVAAVARGSA